MRKVRGNDKKTIGGECGEKKKALGLDWLSAFYL